MKRVISVGLVLALVMVLVGCSTQATSATTTGTSSVTASEGALPMASQLVVGTFRLEDTDQAVNAEEAKELLPLWKAYRNMDGNASSSPVEVQSLLKQIRAAMTEEQLNAVAAMKLTRDDMMQLMQQRGIAMTDNSAGTTGLASTAMRQAERPAIDSEGGPGGNRGGGMPPAGGGVPGGGVPGAEGVPGMGTPGAERPGTGPVAIAVPGPLYNALIELLESKG